MICPQNCLGIDNETDSNYCTHNILKLYYKWAELLESHYINSPEYRFVDLSAVKCNNKWNNIKPTEVRWSLRNLNITNTDIISTFKKTNQLILRKYNGETSLIIGCGNTPLNSGERNKHHHVNCYTMNLDLGFNPSIVGYFGYEKFTYIPDNSFNYVEMEGCSFAGKLTSLFIEELVRITKPNAKLYILTREPNDYFCTKYTSIADIIKNGL